MRLKKILLLLVALCTLSTVVSASDTQDVGSFEIFGVRLGMTPEQVKQQLTEHFSLNPDGFFIEEDKYGAPKIDPVTKIENAFDRIRHESDEIHMYADFSPDVTQEPPTIALTNIAITVRTEEAADLIDELADQFSKQFGKPTLERGSTRIWCNKIETDSFRCHDDSADLTLRHTASAIDGAYVHFSDPAYDERHYEAYKKLGQ